MVHHQIRDLTRSVGSLCGSNSEAFCFNKLKGKLSVFRCTSNSARCLLHRTKNTMEATNTNKATPPTTHMMITAYVGKPPFAPTFVIQFKCNSNWNLRAVDNLFYGCRGRRSKRRRRIRRRRGLDNAASRKDIKNLISNRKYSRLVANNGHGVTTRCRFQLESYCV